MIGDLGWEELLIILVIVALLFGASRVASLGGALGRGIREFREAAAGDSKDEQHETRLLSAPASAPTDLEASLAALTALRDQGVLTAEEFEAKSALLHEHSQPATATEPTAAAPSEVAR